jgi:hypothetical protein
MFIEQETSAPIKNLENQVRLFFYDFTSFTCPHHFVLMTNLLSYVTPIQYLFKEFMSVMDDERDRKGRNFRNWPCRINRSYLFS